MGKPQSKGCVWRGFLLLHHIMTKGKRAHARWRIWPGPFHRNLCELTDLHDDNDPFMIESAQKGPPFHCPTMTKSTRVLEESFILHQLMLVLILSVLWKFSQFLFVWKEFHLLFLFLLSHPETLLLAYFSPP